MIRIVLLLSMYIILPIPYFTMVNDTKPKKNIILGATLPYASLKDPRVLAICTEFKKTLKRSLLILAVLALPCLVVPYISISMAILFTWVIPAIVVPMVIYARYRRRLIDLKKELLHGSETLSSVTYVDLQASVQQSKPLSLWWHLPPLVVACIPVADCLLSYQTKSDGWMLFLYGSVAILPILALLLHGVFQRQSPDVVGDDSNLNATLTRIRRRRYMVFCLGFSWFSGFLCLIPWLMMEERLSYFWGIVFMTLYTIALLVVSFYVEFRTRRQTEQMAPGSPTDMVNDEDRYWIAGQFYYNPQDKHLMKAGRVGVSSTVNMAHPVGKFLTVLSLLCLMSLPVCGLWMMGEEFVPLSCELQDQTIVVSQLWNECEIPLDEIVDTAILEERPDMSRVVGSSIGTLCKGRYKVTGYDICQVYIRDPEGPYLLILTASDKYLLDWTEELAAWMPQ